jgi:hypothetical protein
MDGPTPEPGREPAFEPESARAPETGESPFAPEEPGTEPPEELGTEPPEEPGTEPPEEPGTEPPEADAARSPEGPATSDRPAGARARAGRVVRPLLTRIERFRTTRLATRRRRAAVTAVAAVAVVATLGFFGSSVLLPSSASRTPSPAVSAAATGGSADTSPEPAPTSLGPTVAPTASPTQAESRPAQTAPTAEITLNELVLDPSATGRGLPTTLTFVGDGPGLVAVSIVASAPTDSTRICLSGDGGTPVCASGATPSASFYGVSSQSKWSATLEPAGEASPTIDVTVRWPANKPSLTVLHSPFEGEPNRDSLRSLTATIAARSDGSIGMTASWAPDALATSLTVWQVGSDGLTAVDDASFPVAGGIEPAHVTTVDAGTTYRLTLMNLSPAGAAPDLGATIAFP